MDELAARIVAGDSRALARGCRLIDEQAQAAEALLRTLFAATGQARVIGVTGPPGSGKSTLVDRLIELFRARGDKVGVIAIDPSSPFTGGALLGDRIRMQRHAVDEGVFIRSVGTRGALGGLARSTFDMVHLMDAWGARTILIETVGVGQSELDLLGVAETIAVVLVPGLGDDIQANKAGILEIADVFALNKADRDGVDALEQELRAALALGTRGRAEPTRVHSALIPENARSDEGTPRIVRTVATRAEGVTELFGALDTHGRWLAQTAEGAEQRAARKRASVARHLSRVLTERMLREVETAIGELADGVVARELDPYTAADELFARLLGRGSGSSPD